MINNRTFRRSTNSRMTEAVVPKHSAELVLTALEEFVKLLEDDRVSMVVLERSDGYKRLLAR